jgi:hypothetical protein
VARSRASHVARVKDITSEAEFQQEVLQVRARWARMHAPGVPHSVFSVSMGLLARQAAFS